MKFWRTRTQDQPITRAHDSHTKQIGELRRQVAELERATHDHCIHCGQATPRIGMTECGRVDCARRTA